MSWLRSVIARGLSLRKRECGSTLPDNPTLDDVKKEVHLIAQLAKEFQNTKRPWSDEQWRKISKAIEKVERMTTPH